MTTTITGYPSREPTCPKCGHGLSEIFPGVVRCRWCGHVAEVKRAERNDG